MIEPNLVHSSNWTTVAEWLYECLMSCGIESECGFEKMDDMVYAEIIAPDKEKTYIRINCTSLKKLDQKHWTKYKYWRYSHKSTDNFPKQPQLNYGQHTKDGTLIEVIKMCKERHEKMVRK